MRKYYNTKSNVKITPWDRDNTVDMNEIYTTLSLVRYQRKPSGTVQWKLGDYTEILEGRQRFAIPTRMLVYGRPGIGKSTFSQKVADDWANEKKKALKRFHLLLLIQLRDVCGLQDLPSILRASTLFSADSTISIDNLYEYILQNQDKVLLVLDGYDEYSAEQTSPIREIWEGKQLRDCHVLMTTRQMEGEELIRSSHVQFEIKGFRSKEQVNEFAGKFITDQMEIEEFNKYLSKVGLWDIAEIPLLLLMLCLIWNDRHLKELPKSKLELHERFVETLICHMSIKEPHDDPLESIENRSILNHYREELTVIGKLALDALLRTNLYVNLKDIDIETGFLTSKMIRSGLFQFSKISSADPNKTIFFLHKSIQEFLAAWYIMNEAGVEDGRTSCFKSIDSFKKVLQLKQILKFMCEWLLAGAKAVFSLLRFIGGREDLSLCCNFTGTPLLSEEQRLFRDLSLECLLSCSSSAKTDMYPLFLSCVGDVVSVSYANFRKVTDEHLLRSANKPRYVFFQGSNLPYSILEDLNALVVTCSGRTLMASDFVQRYFVSELEPEHFFLKKEGENVYLYFASISRKYSHPYLAMLKALSSHLLPKESGNCLSMVIDAFFIIATEKELSIVSDVLSAAVSPQNVVIVAEQYRSCHAQTLMGVISNINMTENLQTLRMSNLNLTASGASVIATSLHRDGAPNVRELNLSNCSLNSGVSILAENLRHVPLLSTLTLSRVGMGHQECSSLAAALNHVKELKTLDLSFNQLTGGISELAHHLNNVPCLTHLNLQATDMGEREATALAQKLEEVSSLQFLNTGCSPLGIGVNVLLRHLSNLPNLKELNLQHVLMTNQQIDDITNARRGSSVRTSYHVSCMFSAVLLI